MRSGRRLDSFEWNWIREFGNKVKYHGRLKASGRSYGQCRVGRGYEVSGGVCWFITLWFFSRLGLIGLVTGYLFISLYILAYLIGWSSSSHYCSFFCFLQDWVFIPAFRLYDRFLERFMMVYFSLSIIVLWNLGCSDNIRCLGGSYYSYLFSILCLR